MFKENDGIDHINVCSQGKTKIGQLLSNFAHTPFMHPEDGPFNSVEGYWYWLSCKDDKLRDLWGWKAKEYGRSAGGKDWLADKEFKRKILLALDAKLKYNPLICEALSNLKLPLKHYYVYNGRVVEPAEGKWVIKHLEIIRMASQ